MKKLLLGLAILIGLIAVKDVFADAVRVDSQEGNTKENVTYRSVPPKFAFLYEIWYKDNGEIEVFVGLHNKEGKPCRVKVTPKEIISGAIVEGARFVTIYPDKIESVIFHCKEGKEGDAAACALYDFRVEIVEMWP